CKSAHGAARVQVTPPPVPDTKVRGMASAGAARQTSRIPSVAGNTVVFMESLPQAVNDRGRLSDRGFAGIERARAAQAERAKQRRRSWRDHATSGLRYELHRHRPDAAG